MDAIVVTRFGGPEVLEPVTLPTPEPADGQLRVAVEYAGVGWLDTLIRRGEGPDAFPVQPPYVPGGAVAGTVTATGQGVAGHQPDLPAARRRDRARGHRTAPGDRQDPAPPLTPRRPSPSAFAGK